MMGQGSEKERRTVGERRQANLGAPQGICERRVNIERRLFNLDARCFSAWLGRVAERDAVLEVTS